MRGERARPRSLGWRRRAALFLGGAAIWTLVSCYPNPAALVRSLQRYRHFPVDPGLEKRVGWQIARDPGAIEAFVDSVLLPTPDWQLYRVPWYVPAAGEAARAMRGDCEAKAIVLASLLAGKGIPFTVRASLNHIWVDYRGRKERPGESAELAYLGGEEGRLRLQWPRQVEWRQILAVQQEQLWGAMPLARRSVWLLGVCWLALGAALLGGGEPEGRLRSDWRAPRWPFVGRAAWMGAVVFAVVAVAPSQWREGPGRWTMADLWETLAASALAGAFLAWLSVLHGRRAAEVSEEGEKVVVRSWLGPWGREREVEVSEITHQQLDASPGGLRPWVVSAALRNGERVALAGRREGEPARATLRELGVRLKRAVVVRADGWEARSNPEEIELSLRERAARRPEPEAAARPPGCDLEVEESGGRWVIRHPKVGGGWVVLLGMALFPALVAAGLTYAVLRWPLVLGLWVGWVLAGAFLSLTIYLALMLRGEIVARLAGLEVEVGEGSLNVRSRGKTESVPLERIESVELGRAGEVATIVVVSPERVIEIRDLCEPDHRRWARQVIERAIVESA